MASESSKLPESNLNYKTFNNSEAENEKDLKKNPNSENHSNDKEVSISVQYYNKVGLNCVEAAIFLSGELAGSGVLALPKALVDTGWLGFLFIFLCCFDAGFGGTCLGACWRIIEERYPEHRGKTRNPYAIIGYRALGKWGRYLVSGCMQFSLTGCGIVYLLLSSQIIQRLFENILPNVSFCIWFLIIGIVLAPVMLLGSPKDFRCVGIGALLATALACILIFVQIVMDGLGNTTPVVHQIHSFHEFFMGFGTILFAFGGASTFPTIQNDMKNKAEFSQSVVLAYIVVLILYVPIAAAGYFVYGESVNANIILSLGHSMLGKAANAFFAVHLILAFLIIINPVCQELEEIFRIPKEFSRQRCYLRTGLLAFMIFVGLSIPKFGVILSLIGGSTVTLLTFVFPSGFYMLLCKQQSLKWIPREISPLQQAYIWKLVVLGIIGGSAATYSALNSIFSKNLLELPCYWP